MSGFIWIFLWLVFMVTIWIVAELRYQTKCYLKSRDVQPIVGQVWKDSGRELTILEITPFNGVVIQYVESHFTDFESQDLWSKRLHERKRYLVCDVGENDA